LPRCSAVTTPAGPCLNDEGQQDMKMCTQSEHVSSGSSNGDDNGGDDDGGDGGGDGGNGEDEEGGA
jgi:hypothetical protein